MILCVCSGDEQDDAIINCDFVSLVQEMSKMMQMEQARRSEEEKMMMDRMQRQEETLRKRQEENNLFMQAQVGLASHFRSLYIHIDSGCLSRILIFVHPGSRNPDRKIATKERGDNKFVLPFFVAPKITKL